MIGKNDIFLIFLIIIFLAGIYVILTFNKNINEYTFENFETPSSVAVSTESNGENIVPTTAAAPQTECPDMLIQSGAVLLLYNSKQPVVNGTNPIVFNSLDDYIGYYNEQKMTNSNCPLLYLVKENNAQGEDVFRMRPSPFDLQGGLPVITGVNQESKSGGTTNIPEFSGSGYAGFDPLNTGIGSYTDLDKIHDSTKKQAVSDNPMDPNWGGREYTNKVVDSGKYDDYNISRPVLFNVKSVVFNPNLQNSVGPPQDIY